MRQPPNAKSSIPSFVGDRIRSARLGLGLTQEALGVALGTSASVVSHWESGVRNPGVRALEALGGTLNVSLTWLVSGEDKVRDPDATTQRVSPLIPRPDTPSNSGYNRVLLYAAIEVVIEIFKRRRLKIDPVAVRRAVTLVYEIGVLKGLDQSNTKILTLKRTLREAAENRLRGA